MKTKGKDVWVYAVVGQSPTDLSIALYCSVSKAANKDHALGIALREFKEKHDGLPILMADAFKIDVEAIEDESNS